MTKKGARTEVLRQALLSYRLQFSPETQPIRQSVLEHSILLNLYSARSTGSTESALCTLKFEGAVVLNSSLDEIRPITAQLVERELIQEFEDNRGKKRFRLTESGHSQLTEVREQSEGIVETCTKKLSLPNDAANTFLYAVAILFDTTSQFYVSGLFNTEDDGSELRSAIPRALASALKAYPFSDKKLVEHKLKRFVSDSDPDYERLKWSLSKGSFAIRAAGLSENSDVLSEEMLSKKVFYLDTNVLLPAIDSSLENHAPVDAALKSLRSIGCKLKITVPTIDEYRNLVEKVGNNAQLFREKFSERILRKSNGAAARILLDQGEAANGQSIGEYLEKISQRDYIQEITGADIDDNQELEHLEAREDVQRRAERLKALYDHNSWRTKTFSAAVHDAICLTYIDELNDHALHLLTLDRSLPAEEHEARDGRNKAELKKSVYLPSLIPWLGITLDDNAEITQLASRMFGLHLVSFGSGFSSTEMRMLAALDIDCRKLPDEDVEACLYKLREFSTQIDITTAEGREKVSHAIRSYFSDPTTHAAKRISDLENSLKVSGEQRKSESDRSRRKIKDAQESTATAWSAVGIFASMLASVVLGLVLYILYGPIEKIGELSQFIAISALPVPPGLWLTRVFVKQLFPDVAPKWL